MIAHAQVHQLVQEHVVPHLVRHLHEPPVQADPSVRGARAPPRSLVPDTDAVHDESVLGRELAQARRQLQPSPSRAASGAPSRGPRRREPARRAYPDAKRLGVSLAGLAGTCPPRARCRQWRADAHAPPARPVRRARARATRGAPRRTAGPRADCPRRGTVTTASSAAERRSTYRRARGCRTNREPPAHHRRQSPHAPVAEDPPAAATAAAAAARVVRGMAWDHTPSTCQSFQTSSPTSTRSCRGLSDDRIERVAIASPFLVRSVDPPVSVARRTRGRAVDVSANGIVIDAGDELFAVVHLMIAGRLHWRAPRSAAEDADDAGGVRLRARHAPADRGGLEATRVSDPGARPGGARRAGSWRTRRVRRNHRGFRCHASARKPHAQARAHRSRILDGIGNAYSDEILHAAQLSPMQLTTRLSDDELVRLHEAPKATLTAWTARLRPKRPAGVSREGDGVSGGDGRPRPVWQAVPALRRARPTNQLRGPRVQLLRGMPARGTPARGPRALAPARTRLAENARGTGGEEGARERERDRLGVSFRGSVLAGARPRPEPSGSPRLRPRLSLRPSPCRRRRSEDLRHISTGWPGGPAPRDAHAPCLPCRERSLAVLCRGGRRRWRLRGLDLLARDEAVGEPGVRGGVTRARRASSAESNSRRGSRSCIDGHVPSARRFAYRHQNDRCQVTNCRTFSRPRSSSCQCSSASST